MKIALIGCGGRGTGAASQALSTDGPVRLVAMADVFPARLEASWKYLSGLEELKGRVDVPPERRFIGFDAYQKVLALDVDLVLLTTSPHFRPIHYPAAVAAGKHVYMEKPVAVDAPGVRLIEQANAAAKQKGLRVAVGFQRRHEEACRKAVDRIRAGEIGPSNGCGATTSCPARSAGRPSSPARRKCSISCGSGRTSRGSPATTSSSSTSTRST